jgi:hypothetical protein
MYALIFTLFEGISNANSITMQSPAPSSSPVLPSPFSPEISAFERTSFSENACLSLPTIYVSDADAMVVYQVPESFTAAAPADGGTCDPRDYPGGRPPGHPPGRPPGRPRGSGRGRGGGGALHVPTDRVTRSRGSHKSEKIILNEAVEQELNEVKSDKARRQAMRSRRKDWES